jgi:steroid delta-isomerase-like uncharacterized protein
MDDWRCAADSSLTAELEERSKPVELALLTIQRFVDGKTMVLIDLRGNAAHAGHACDGEGIMGTGKDLWNQLETLYLKKDYTGLASLLASDAVHVDPNGRHVGGEAFATYNEQSDKPFSDIRLETSQLVQEGDTVVAEWTWRATHTGPMAMPDGTEIPPTGKTVELPGATVGRFADGKFTTVRDYFDNAAVMSQLGLMPST